MASPALDSFTTWVDSTSLNQTNKNLVKGRGVLLYEAATQEEAAHVIRHLDAAISTASGETLLRLERLRLIVDALTTETSPHLGTDVVNLLIPVTNVELRVIQSLGYLFMSKTVNQASARWDEMAEGGIPVAIQNRLKALRDLITAKLGA